MADVTSEGLGYRPGQNLEQASPDLLRAIADIRRGGD
jgi:hypothetical protein